MAARKVVLGAVTRLEDTSDMKWILYVATVAMHEYLQ